VNHLEGGRGTIALGNVADLVVLGTDPFELEDPGGVRADLTMIGGTVVHERGA
jgi:predicted amidohydrolase YtcJ